MEKSLAFLLLCLILQIYSQQSNNPQPSYHHEKENRSQKVLSNDFEIYSKNDSKRELQSSSPQPIRISLDYSHLYQAKEGITLKKDQITLIKKLFEIAVDFFSKLIKVIPRQNPIKMQSKICQDISTSSEIQNEGISNSDLHIFVTHSNKIEHLANAIHCDFDDYPKVGRIQLNMQELDDRIFSDNLLTVFHEIIHILGFNINYIDQWKHSEYNKIILYQSKQNGIDQFSIHSKNIRRVAINHFGCSKINGMLLEDYRYKSSHWEYDLIKYEIMASGSSEGIFSQFTTALLLDTGYFAQVNQNLSTKSIWGKHQGCNFFYKTCNSNQYTHLFSKKDQKVGCSFDYIGSGVFRQYTFSKCNSIGHTFPCQDDTQISEKNKKNTYGDQSMCFISNASPKEYQIQDISARCFQNKCLENGTIQVKIQENEYVDCQYPGQIIDLSTSTKSSHGILRCPHNFDLICKKSLQCLNDCSQNGFCINGYCICKNLYAGEDCSKHCPQAQLSAWDGSKCVSSCGEGFFKNFDNTCKRSCPESYYGDQQTRNCELCHNYCFSCYGPSQRECTSCNEGYLLEGNTCEEGNCHKRCQTCNGKGENQCTSCEIGFYLDYYEKSCKQCKSPCEACISEKECLSCIQGYKFDENRTLQCYKENQLDNCSNSENNICKECMPGYSLSIQNGCEKCKANCKSCNINGYCLLCNEGFIIDRHTNTCKVKCSEHCLTCEDNNPQKCTGCKDGFKLQNESNTCKSQCADGQYLEYYEQTCKPCFDSCATCLDSPFQCQTCKKGFILKKGICQKQQQGSCKGCKVQDQKHFIIQMCQEGYVLKNKICRRCKTPCKTCIDNQTKCLSCIDDLKYKYDEYNQKCLKR